jgi:hypothetical protein
MTGDNLTTDSPIQHASQRRPPPPHHQNSCQPRANFKLQLQQHGRFGRRPLATSSLGRSGRASVRPLLHRCLAVVVVLLVRRRRRTPNDFPVVCRPPDRDWLLACAGFLAATPTTHLCPIPSRPVTTRPTVSPQSIPDLDGRACCRLQGKTGARPERGAAAGGRGGPTSSLSKHGGEGARRAREGRRACDVWVS